MNWYNSLPSINKYYQKPQESFPSISIRGTDEGLDVHLWLTGSGVDQDSFTSINLEDLIPQEVDNELGS